ncbi:MAG TPA: methyltransferase domain-containing protein [Gemmatimonadaceae bacterium]|nr:methyltransferase domain-containing protein [Gemmatimonadaceae bacterium]
MDRDLFKLHAAIEHRHWWFVGRRRILAALVERLVPAAGGLVVDVGCGTGANVAALAGRYRAVGSDTSRDGIALARERHPEVRFVLGEAPAAIADDVAAADVVMLTDVIEHVPDDFALVSRLLAAMKPGAHLLVTVPAHESLWSEHDVSFGHYRRYEAPRLAAVWEGLPVSVRLLSYFNARLYPVVRSVRALSRLRGRASGAAGTDFNVPARPVNRALTSIFAGERTRLVAALDAPLDGSSSLSRGSYGTGVSLVAALRRGDGVIGPRERGTRVPPDRHQPEPAA